MAKKTEDKIRVIVDTREQLPYTFKHEPLIEPVSGKLDQGDYALVGFEGALIVERKNVADILGCMGNGRDRFTKELKRLRECCAMPILLIEGNLVDMWEGFQARRSRVHANSIVGSLMTWIPRYGIFPLFGVNRQISETLCARLLIKTYDHLTHGAEKYEDNWIMKFYVSFKGD